MALAWQVFPVESIKSLRYGKWLEELIHSCVGGSGLRPSPKTRDLPFLQLTSLASAREEEKG